MNTLSNLWKGLVSYTEEDIIESRYIFSGRSDVTLSLLSMVKNNLLVTFYGKSGIGKTSMLQAGLFPLLRRDNYLPVLLRPAEIDYVNFDAYVIDTVKYQLEKHQVVRYIAGEDGRFNRPIVNDAGDSCNNIALWFASSKFYDSDNREVFPVLVFDQFEALFLGGRNKGNEVLRGLHMMIDDSELKCPDDVVCHNEANFRILLVVREDDLFRLEDAIDELGYNSMKFNRLRLRALTDDQAREVIEKPIDDLKAKTGFSLVPDNEREAVINRIIDISRNRSGKVDSAILSLICSELYTMAGGGCITTALVDRIGANPLGDFYKRAVSTLDDTGRRYIESLVDARGRRRTVFRSNVDKYIKNSDRLFTGSNKLLQNVPGTKPADGNPDNQPVELVHDLLAKAVAQSKGKRRKISGYMARKSFVMMLSILLFVTVICFIGTQMNIKEYLAGDDKSVDGYEIVYLGKTRYKVNFNGTYSNRADIDSIYINLDSIKAHAAPVSIRNCASLKKIKFSSKPSDTISMLRLFVADCPALTEITLADSLILGLNIRVKNSPNLGPLKIARDVQYLTAGINRGEFSIDTKSNVLQIDPRNEFYRYSQGVLWDVKRQKVCIVTDSVSLVAFPDELAHLDSIELYSYDVHRQSFLPQKKLIKAGAVYNTRIKEGLPHEISKATITNVKAGYLEKFADPYYEDSVSLKYLEIDAIADNAFEKCRISDVNFPDSLSMIGVRAFSNNPNLTKIYMPDCVRYVGDYAFADCENLVEVSVNKNTYIRHTAFANSPNVVLKVRDDNGYERIFNRNDPHWPWNPVRNSDYINNVIFDLCSSFDNSDLYIPESRKFDIMGGYLGEHDYIEYSANGNDSTYLSFEEHGVKFRSNRIFILHDVQFCIPAPGEQKVYILPERGDFKGVKFMSLPVDVREIYLPFKNPYFVDEDSVGNEVIANRSYGYIDIPDSLKQLITLYVPSGSAPVYKTISQYRGFKAIKEINNFELANIKIFYYTDIPALFAKNGRSIALGILAVLLVLAAIVVLTYYPVSKMTKEIQPKRRWVFLLCEIGSIYLIIVTVFPFAYLTSILIFDSSITSGVVKGLIFMFAALMVGFYSGLPRGERVPPWLRRMLGRAKSR